MQQLTPVVIRILIANIFMFALPYIIGGLGNLVGFSDSFTAWLISTFPNRHYQEIAPYGFETLVRQFVMDMLALHNPLSEYFGIHQFVTAVFLHSDLNHIFGNMLGLIMFGPMIELAVGSKRFVTFYFITAIGAGLIYLATNTIELKRTQNSGQEVLEHVTPDNVARFMAEQDPILYRNNTVWLRKFSKDKTNLDYITESVSYIKSKLTKALDTPMIGASGAIMGIIMVFGLLFPNTEFFLLFIPIPLQAKYIVAGYFLYDVFRVFQNSPDDHVAHYAHLGGMLFGWIFVLYWRKTTKSFY